MDAKTPSIILFRILCASNIFLGLGITKLILSIRNLENPGMGGLAYVPIILAGLLCSIGLSISTYRTYKSIESKQKMYPFDTFLVLTSVFYPGIFNFILLNVN